LRLDRELRPHPFLLSRFFARKALGDSLPFFFFFSPLSFFSGEGRNETPTPFNRSRARPATPATFFLPFSFFLPPGSQRFFLQRSKEGRWRCFIFFSPPLLFLLERSASAQILFSSFYVDPRRRCVLEAFFFLSFPLSHRSLQQNLQRLLSPSRGDSSPPLSPLFHTNTQCPAW